ncbi:DNRLRE domain-containing protein [Massilia sp. G4R7]|uniref:DNRLRE domain-containing protein n=1 Tax=Massilia phyllostachyos TaxID=2898585 RepID=A0ABS8QBK5_9BURK|nr:DNRLRE domain-containing protein [Massilia phyllostachyos]
MKRRMQDGIMLLPVVLALAVVGVLAFSMTREGGMGAAAVDADYEIARVRYLAEAGVTLARWQNEQEGCGSTKRHTAPVVFPGGRVTIDRVGKAPNGVSVDVSASLDAATAGATPATLALSREVQMRTVKEADLDEDEKSADTYIGSGGATNVDKQSNLIVADGKSHALIRFKPIPELKDSVVARAELRLELDASPKLLGATGTLTVHPIEREWDPKNVSWTAPWTAPGGDAGPAAGSVQLRTSSEELTIRIDALVQDWASGVPEFGMLVKSQGVTEARIDSFEGGDEPELVVRYYTLCKK